MPRITVVERVDDSYVDDALARIEAINDESETMLAGLLARRPASRGSSSFEESMRRIQANLDEIDRRRFPLRADGRPALQVLKGGRS